MGKTIEFEGGKREYDLNGKVTVRFCPTDEGFTAKLEDTFAQLEGLQGNLSGDGGFSKFSELDADMRASIDA